MQELIETIEIIRKRIKKHKGSLARNEAMTRYALIDPLLKVLGWDVSDPDIVTPEDRESGTGRIDYTMGKSVAVEAKKLDERLDKHVEQLMSSVKSSKVRYGILTNGARWRMYDSWESMSGVKIEFDVMAPMGVVIRKAASLHRLVVEERYHQASPPRHAPEPNGNEPPNPASSRPIQNIKPTKGMSPPAELVCPDETIPIQSWVDILVGVATWLVKKNYLNESHCPVPRGPKNVLLNRYPVHQDSSKKIRVYKEVGSLYLNTEGAAQNVGGYSVKLIKAAKQNPADFLVRFAESKET